MTQFTDGLFRMAGSDHSPTKKSNREFGHNFFIKDKAGVTVRTSPIAFTLTTSILGDVFKDLLFRIENLYNDYRIRLNTVL
jgi:hypothetical protein